MEPGPLARARAASPTDVVQVINFCRRYGLEIAVRGAGHSFAGHSSTTGLLIETGLMCAVAVEGDLATIGAAPGSPGSTGRCMITKPPLPPAVDQPSASLVSL
jgi:FAD/FMN-containing dehydrogenase